MISIQREDEVLEVHEKLPILPLRDVVIYPYMIFPLLVGRQISVTALQEAMMLDRQILLCTQKDPSVEVPKKDDLYRMGIVARVLSKRVCACKLLPLSSKKSWAKIPPAGFLL